MPMELEKQFINFNLWYMNNNAKVKIKWEFSIFHNTTSDLYVLCLPLSIGGASNKRFQRILVNIFQNWPERASAMYTVYSI